MMMTDLNSLRRTCVSGERRAPEAGDAGTNIPEALEPGAAGADGARGLLHRAEQHWSLHGGRGRLLERPPSRRQRLDEHLVG